MACSLLGKNPMRIKEEIALTGRKFFIGARGLAHLEFKDLLAEFTKQTIAKTLFLLTVLLASAWISVAIAFWCAEYWTWTSVATGMAAATLALTAALFYFPKFKLKREAKLKNPEVLPPELVETKEDFKKMIAEATQDALAISHEIRDVTRVALNPAIAAEKVINKNPLAFFLGAAAVGIYLGTRYQRSIVNSEVIRAANKERKHEQPKPKLNPRFKGVLEPRPIDRHS